MHSWCRIHFCTAFILSWHLLVHVVTELSSLWLQAKQRLFSRHYLLNPISTHAEIAVIHGPGSCHIPAHLIGFCLGYRSQKCLVMDMSLNQTIPNQTSHNCLNWDSPANRIQSAVLRWVRYCELTEAYDYSTLASMKGKKAHPAGLCQSGSIDCFILRLYLYVCMIHWYKKWIVLWQSGLHFAAFCSSTKRTVMDKREIYSRIGTILVP